MKTIRLLILEDDLPTLSKILDKLANTEGVSAEAGNPIDFSIVVLSEYTQVEEYVNKSENFNFDVILLDRDCKVGGSFHVLDIERVGPDKIISISSIPEYNEDTRKRGIKRVVWKNYQDLESFSNNIIKEILSLINKSG